MKLLPQQKHNLYESYVRQYAADLYRFALRRCGNPQVAEELVQETYVEAWNSLQTLLQPERGKAWLFQILRRRYARWLEAQRKQRERETASVEMIHENVVSLSRHDRRLEQRERLQYALARLEEHYKEPFLMVFLLGFTCQETADELGLPLGTVLSRVHRARQHLRHYLEQDDDMLDKKLAKFPPSGKR